METKTCNKCQETKTLDQFNKSSVKYLKYGVDYYCKYCRSGANIRSHRMKDKKCSLDTCNKPHYAKTYCRMHYTRMQRNGQLETLSKPVDAYERRDYHLRLKYLISLDEFNKRAINGCEICGDKPERSLHVDHDHKCCSGNKTCGKCVRGILCNKCNKAVDKYETGLMRADYPDLDKVAEYVRKYNG